MPASLPKDQRASKANWTEFASRQSLNCDSIQLRNAEHAASTCSATLRRTPSREHAFQQDHSIPTNLWSSGCDAHRELRRAQSSAYLLAKARVKNAVQLGSRCDFRRGRGFRSHDDSRAVTLNRATTGKGDWDTARSSTAFRFLRHTGLSRRLRVFVVRTAGVLPFCRGAAALLTTDRATAKCSRRTAHHRQRHYSPDQKGLKQSLSTIHPLSLSIASRSLRAAADCKDYFAGPY